MLNSVEVRDASHARDIELIEVEFCRLNRENRLLRRKLDVVSNSGLYAVSLFFSALANSCARNFDKVASGFRPWLNPVLKRFRRSSNVRALVSSTQVSGLFDEAWYGAQIEHLNIDQACDPLEHYLTVGWRMRLSPSPFFDAKYVLRQLPNSVPDVCPLEIFVDQWRTLNLNPCLLFDTAYYLEQIGDQAIDCDPVTHFLNSDLDVSPSPLFDPAFYCVAYPGQKGGPANWHKFMTSGRFELKQPNAFFVPSFYRTQEQVGRLGNVDDSVLLLEHYLQVGHLNSARPHPDFDPDYYAALVSNSTGLPQDPLSHFLAVGKNVGLIPNQRLRELLLRQLSDFGSDPGIKHKVLNFSRSHFCLGVDTGTWLRLSTLKDSESKVMVFLGHEASLTGAPMVLLELVQNFSRHGYECLVLLERGGALVEKYRAYATVEVLDNANDHTHRAAECLRALLVNVDRSRVLGAIASTAEVTQVQTVLQAHGLRTICLVHEFADSYNQSHFEKLYASSDVVVFSSRLLLQEADKKASLDSVESVVCPQGLVSQRENGASKSIDARQIVRNGLELADNTFIVLCCGSLDQRKGIDLFAGVVKAVAGICIEQERPIHFVWIGDGSKANHTPYYYAVWDLKQTQNFSKVDFLEPIDDLSVWFAGADVFLLPSRQDPLPCVAQSAMAAGLPVVAFEGAGGIPEAIASGGGTIVPYGDTEAAARAIADYYLHEAKRLRHGEVGRQVCKERFTFADYYARIVSLLTSDQVQSQPVSMVATLPKSVSRETDALPEPQTNFETVSCSASSPVIRSGG